ncbi:MAG: beta-propeller domain-containing protein [Patescibacteria group bacterium]|nr:beta-propeller domain-containing protein [Patescibacteria group bacterium]
MPAKKTKKSFDQAKATPLMLIALIFLSAIAILVILQNSDAMKNDKYPSYKISRQSLAGDTFKKFQSEDQFKKYLENVSQTGYYGFGGARDMMVKEAFANETAPMPVADSAAGSASPERYSQTNVQVAGIDEPDIVKTDGQSIYFSRDNFYYGIPEIMPMFSEDLPVSDIGDSNFASPRIMPPLYQSKTAVIDAWPPADLSKLSDIDKGGQLLLYENTLVVFGNDKQVYGYDVSKPENPIKVWDFKIEEKSYLVSARLYSGKIYMLTSTYSDFNRPCPFYPLSKGEDKLEVRCTDIYYPTAPVATDSIYTAIVFDPKTGQTGPAVSFLGSSYSSVLYMSQDNIYLAYQGQKPYFDLMYDFLFSAARDVLPRDVLDRIVRLNSYDLSYRAKEAELEDILYRWQNSLDRDQLLQLENEMQNRLRRYYQEKKRELGYTGIAKISLAKMDIVASGKVPGRLLNQFSLDEYQGNLRLATTIDSQFFAFGFFDSDSANDVYVLDPNLRLKGKIEDLGLTERIYSARFIGDRGYLVTFRQIDPFYILDLSDPSRPQMTGELKIPGYSSYLHPLDKDYVLGIGMQDFRLKISYFDVSDANNPREIDNYIINDYGSEVLHNHHAFLLDPKHEIFFLPGYQGGYIFSYQDRSFTLKKAISLSGVKRAIYLEDFLYVIGDEVIVVLDQNSWEEIKRLALE